METANKAVCKYPVKKNYPSFKPVANFAGKNVKYLIQNPKPNLDYFKGSNFFSIRCLFYLDELFSIPSTPGTHTLGFSYCFGSG